MKKAIQNVVGYLKENTDLEEIYKSSGKRFSVHARNGVEHAPIPFHKHNVVAFGYGIDTDERHHAFGRTLRGAKRNLKREIDFQTASAIDSETSPEMIGQ
jgi:hypothetical protein